MAVDAKFERIQGLPTYMPEDILGYETIVEELDGTRRIHFKPGKLMAHIVLIDEDNRLTAKTKAAVLEGMEESSATLASDYGNMAETKTIPLYPLSCDFRHTMPDLIGFLRDGVEFGNPRVLMFLPIAAASMALAVLVQAVIVRRSPPRTRGSSYPRIGRTKLWFAAEPRILSTGAVFKRGNVDLAIAIDVSASMWVRDQGQSRLEVAVREVLDLETQGILHAGDRAGLFVFGGTAIRKVHLSSNLERLMEAVRKLGPRQTLTGDWFPWDSDIAAALEHIGQSLDTQDRFDAGADATRWTPTRRSDRAVVLIGDGDFAADQQQLQRLELALAEFRRRGVPFYAVGVGSRTGQALTTVLDDYTPGRDYDKSLASELEGQHTRLSMLNLSFLAQRTGGKTFMIDSLGRRAAPFLRDAIEAHRTVSFQLTRKQEKQAVWQYVVAAGIVLFAASVLVY